MRNKIKMYINLLVTSILIALYSSSGFALTADELRNAQYTAGHLTSLSHRMSRLYMRYRYQSSAVSSRDELYAAVDVFNQSLDILENGSLVDIVPAPPNEAIKTRIQELKDAWEPLRKIYASQRTTSFIESDIVIPRSRSRDTVLLSYLEKSNETLAKSAGGIPVEYRNYCEEQKMDVGCWPHVAVVGQLRERTEQIAKYVMLINLNLDTEVYKARLEEVRDDFIKRLEALKEQAGGLENDIWAEPIIQTIEAYWYQYQINVNEALNGSPENIRQDVMERTYRNLVAELDNYVLNVLSLIHY